MGVCGKVDVGNGVMDKGDKSLPIRRVLAVLMDSGVLGKELVGRSIGSFSLDSCRYSDI